MEIRVVGGGIEKSGIGACVIVEAEVGSRYVRELYICPSKASPGAGVLRRGNGHGDRFCIREWSCIQTGHVLSRSSFKPWWCIGGPSVLLNWIYLR